MYTKRVAIIGYKLGSGSVRELSRGLGQVLNIPVLRVRKDSKRYQPRYTDYIINWGCSQNWEYITHDNKDGHQRVVNKLDFFKCVTQHNNTEAEKQVNIPPWTIDPNIAKTFKGTVVCRAILNGHSGAGISLHDVSPDMVLPKVPLYVEYKKKKHEYRVHVFNEQVIDVTQKKKRKGAEFLDTKIRNHKNGWVYCREDITEPHDLRTQATRAMSAVGLKFGAVDIIWNELENKSYVLEINTAPGLIGTTLEKYIQAFKDDIK